MKIQFEATLKELNQRKTQKLQMPITSANLDKYKKQIETGLRQVLEMKDSDVVIIRITE